MVIFRENCEDIYAGIEFEAGSGARRSSSRSMFRRDMKVRQDPFPGTSGIGIKPCPRTAPSALIALGHRVRHRQQAKSVTLVHKGNIMKFTEGAFRNWGYALAEREFGDKGLHLGPVGAHQGRQGRSRNGQRRAGPPLWAAGYSGRCRHQGRHRRHHAAAGADAPDEFDVIATLNLNGDYLSDALARRSAASASRRAATSTTSPATPCSKRRTAPRRSTPTSTR